jgi:hypothetical protein
MGSSPSESNIGWGIPAKLGLTHDAYYGVSP